VVSQLWSSGILGSDCTWGSDVNSMVERWTSISGKAATSAKIATSF
jgi:hypothetical protein